MALLAVLLELTHAATLLLLKHPLIASNLIQLLLPLVAVAGCVVKRSEISERQDRRKWEMLAVAFGIWSCAEVAYLCELYLLPRVRPWSEMDDVLWLFFAVPFLVLLSGCLEGRLGRISLLDQTQAVLSFVVVSVLVFSRIPELTFNQAYDVQNVTLLLSCVVRYSMSHCRRDRGMFRDLGIYLATYFVCAGVGNHVSAKGFDPGSLVDLFWTVPITTFCVVSFYRAPRIAGVSGAEEESAAWHTWARHMHDLSALSLAGLSMAASAYLVYSRPVLGYLFLGTSFALLATRTYARSVELHYANDSLKESLLTDSLTGLGNRARLRGALDVLSKELVHAPGSSLLALLFIDLDRFKAINDGLGHEAGDRILIELGRRIQTTLPPPAIACRLGGDEFIGLIKVRDRQEGEQVANQLLEAIRAPLRLGEKVLQLSASVGLVLNTEQEAPDDLLRKADQAMYEAKRRGKDRVHEFSDALEEKQSSFRLENELRECLQKRKIELYLQPIYALSSAKISGFEALARWTHPVFGPIPPSTFIPLAEANGTILELGRQMLAGGIDAIARWNQERGVKAWVSVNVSALQLSDPELLPYVLELLARNGLDPHLLHLEITESVMLSDDKDRMAVLTEARRYGIQVSLDDFGTGYSSLSYLLNFATDEIKIDRGFIRGIDTDARRMELVRTVLHLGASLKKRVIAEGVENELELAMLKSLGSEYVQGYLLSKPMPADALGCLAAEHELILHGVLGAKLTLSSATIQ